MANGVDEQVVANSAAAGFAGIIFNPETDSLIGNIETIISTIASAAPATGVFSYYDLMARVIKSLQVDLYGGNSESLVTAFEAAAVAAGISEDIRTFVSAEISGQKIVDVSNFGATVVGSSLTESFMIDEGGHTIIGQGGNDSYINITGISGTTTIDDSGGAGDRLILATTNSSDVSISRVGGSGDVVLSVSGGGSITIHNDLFQNTIETIQFADGVSWDLAYIKQTLLDQQSATNGGAVYGYGGSDTIIAGLGDKYLNGGGGTDTYVYSSAGGNDVIDDGQNLASTLQFTDIASTDVTISRPGGDVNLVITNMLTGKTVTILREFANGGPLDTITFSDGVSWTYDHVIALVGDGNAEQLIVIGTAGDDTLNGTSSQQVFDGGPGNDAIAGGSGGDTYLFGLGSGNDTITEYDFQSGTDTVRLVDLNASDVTFSRSGNDLLIEVDSSGETVRVADQFTGANGIERVQFANGTIWDRSETRLAV